LVDGRWNHSTCIVRIQVWPGSRPPPDHVNQYGSQGLTKKPMLIPEVDFSGIARALGAAADLLTPPWRPR
jgi:hypothetical protein